MKGKAIPSVFGSEVVSTYHSNLVTYSSNVKRVVEELTIPSAGWWFVEALLYISTRDGNNDALYATLQVDPNQSYVDPLLNRSLPFSDNAYVHMMEGSVSRLYYFPAGGFKLQLCANTNGSAYNVSSRYILATKIKDI